MARSESVMTLAESYGHIACSGCNGSDWKIVENIACLREELPSRMPNNAFCKTYAYTGDRYVIAVCGCSARHSATSEQRGPWQGDASAVALMNADATALNAKH